MEEKMTGSYLDMYSNFAEYDEHLQKKAIISYFLQAIPWMVFVTVLVIEEIITISTTIGSSDEKIFTYILLITIGLLIICIVVGTILSIYNTHELINIFLMGVVFVLSGTGSIGYVTVQIAGERDLYSWLLGVPLAVLTFSHFFWSLFCTQIPFHCVHSSIVIAFTAASPYIILLLGEIFDDDTYPNLLSKIIITSLAHLLFATSWCVGMKATLQYKNMPHANRFFFVVAGTICWSLVFILSLIIVPIVWGIKVLCLKANSPKAPVKPTAPEKPEKPIKPEGEDNSEEMNHYKKKIAEYKTKKKQIQKREKILQRARERITIVNY